MKTKLVVFGITGDLSRRKLLPALRDIVKTGEYEDLSIIGVSRREVKPADVVGDNSELIDRTTVFTMDLAEAGDYRRLSDFLDLEPSEQALMYLSVPPNAAADIVDFLGQAGLNTPNIKILFEKPFGFDLVSAQDFLERTGRYFSEAQIYRIDHYMAKDVTQYILKLRMDAENHHHSWDSHTVAAIDVVASEKIGIEGRGIFYEEVGALRDFIQCHLMQVLSLVLMDVTGSFELDKLAEHRLKALQQLHPADPSSARRAQYKGYQAEVGNVGSLTETFASLELHSNDERWQDVPLRLITGKNLAEKRSYILVTYRDGTSDTFEEGKTPVEGRLKNAYERVIIDAVNDRKHIFTTGPEVLRSWEIVAPVLRAWEFDDQPLSLYSPGVVVDDLLS